MYVCMHVCVCARARVCVCMCVCVNEQVSFDHTGASETEDHSLSVSERGRVVRERVPSLMLRPRSLTSSSSSSRPSSGVCPVAFSFFPPFPPIFLCVRVCVYMYMYMYMYIYVCMCICIFLCVYLYLQTQTHTPRTHTHAHTHTHTHTHLSQLFSL